MSGLAIETKQQAIELQVFITKLYFNRLLWNNEFVRVFFDNSIEMENLFEKEMNIKYDIEQIK